MTPEHDARGIGKEGAAVAGALQHGDLRNGFELAPQGVEGPTAGLFDKTVDGERPAGDFGRANPGIAPVLRANSRDRA